MPRKQSQTFPAKKSWNERSRFKLPASQTLLGRPPLHHPLLSLQAVVKVASVDLVEAVEEAVVVVADLPVAVALYVKSSTTTEEMLTHEKDAGENGETTDALPLTDDTNEANQAPAGAPKEPKPRTPRPLRQRGPPEDGIPSTTKVMVANLPYDLSEDKVFSLSLHHITDADFQCSSRNSSRPTNRPQQRLLFVPSPDSW